MKFARLALYFLVGLFLGGVSVLSFAETTPATSGYEQVPAQYYGKNGNGIFADPMAACATYASGSYKITYKANQTWCEWTTGGVITPISAWCPQGGYQGYWPSPDAAPICRRSGLVCPDATWTLSGTICTRPDCPNGRLPNGTCSSCTPPATQQSDGTCRATCGEVVVTPSGSCVRSTPCTGGDSATLAMLAKSQPICSDNKPKDPQKCNGVVIGTFQGKDICLSPPPDDPTCTATGGKVVGTLNGQPVCSNPAGNPKCGDGSASQGSINGQPVCSDGCPSGTAKGTVNGVSSCYPVGPTTTKTTTQTAGSQGTTTTTTTTTPGGGTTTSTSGGSSATTCDGDRCTTTTTTTDGSGGTSTTTAEQDKGDFCKQHPKASVCTGESDQDQYCKDNPDAVSCLKTGTPGEEGGLTTVEKGVSSITPVSIASANGCPADVQLPKGAVFSYAGPCMFAEGMRPVILASAWLIAGLIVLGMTRNG